jgi:hypothetical protein
MPGLFTVIQNKEVVMWEFHEYPKIQSIFKRDEKGKFLDGVWSRPEIEYLRNNTWCWTEKVNGTNIRIGWHGGKIVLGGRTDNAQIPATLIQYLQELFPEEKMREVFPDSDVVLFGEGYGRKIQKVGSLYIPNGVGFILFDVMVGRWWLNREDVEDVADKLGVKVVPIRCRSNIENATDFVKAKPMSLLSSNVPFAEGLVGTPMVQMFSRNGTRVMTKIKVKDFE